MLIPPYLILIAAAVILIVLFYSIKKKNKILIFISTIAAPPILFLATDYLAKIVFAAKTERSGVVIDKETSKPLEGVKIENYRAFSNRELALNPEVTTDKNGYFHIKQKINENTLFSLDLDGYYGFVNKLPKQGDTIRLEKIKSDAE